MTTQNWASGEFGNFFADLCGDPTRELTIYVVTGTDGKTTTSYFLYQLLNAMGVRAGLVSSVGARTPDWSEETGYTTPPLPQLQRLLARILHSGCTHAVVEVSSHAIHLGRIDQIRVDFGVWTNFSPDHLGLHGSVEAYANTKKRLFIEWCDGGAVVLNADDPVCMATCSELSDKTILSTFGTSGTKDGRSLTFEVESQCLEGSELLFEDVSGAVGVSVGFFGDHNAANLAAALAALRLEGHSLDKAVGAAAKVELPSGRLQRIWCCPAVFVDFAHTAKALEESLAAVRRAMPETAQLIVVFGAGGAYSSDVDQSDIRHDMGRILSRGTDHTFLTTDSPRSEDPGDICAELVAFMDRNRVEIELDRNSAIERAVGEAGDDDVVVVAGRGIQTRQDFGTHSVNFCDLTAVFDAVQASSYA